MNTLIRKQTLIQTIERYKKNYYKYYSYIIKEITEADPKNVEGIVSAYEDLVDKWEAKP